VTRRQPVPGSFRARFGLLLPHRAVLVGAVAADPAYLAMNPNGLVPTIEDDGFILWESNECIRYIAASSVPHAMADRSAPARRRRALDGLAAHHALTSGLDDLPGLVPTKLEQRDIAAIAAANERFNELWTIVDKVLATRKFVAGDQLTIGDIPMGIAAFAIPVERDHHPNFEALYGRLTERPAFRRT
jgi:glutathione S-transferase